MKIYSLTTSELTSNLNIGKNHLAETLYDAGVITSEQFRTIVEDFALVQVEANFFGKAMAQVLGWDWKKEGLYIKCVQVRNIQYNKDNKNDVYQPEDGDQ